MQEHQVSESGTAPSRAGVRGRRKPRLAAVCLIGGAVALSAAACSSSAASSSAPSSPASAGASSSAASAGGSAAGSATALNVTGLSSCTLAPSAGEAAAPSLSGDTITIANPAPPQLSDVQQYLMTQILKTWGANSSLVAQVGDPATTRVVLSGAATVAAVGAEAPINTGLVTFGPVHPKADYIMVGAKGLTSVSQLQGKSYGVSNTEGSEALMLGLVLKAQGMTTSDVQEVVAGTGSVRLTALEAGHIDATWAHADGYIALKSSGYSDLANMATVDPKYSPLMLAAPASWISGHTAEAVAIDRSWIEAARLMQNQACFTQAAQTYVTAAKPSTISQDYQILVKQLNIAPPEASVYSDALGTYNAQVVASIPGILSKKPGPLSSWFTDSIWTQATAAEGLG
jgi:ABC-type nitrate/sulfonate/bicarbonate transport system substrate-binding protein